MSRPRRLDAEQLDRMAGWREEGRSYRWISSRFAADGISISGSAIAWQCMRAGAWPPPAQRAPLGTKPGGNVRAFSAEEDLQLLALEREGMKVHRIALALGRANSSVRGRLLTLARRDAYAEGAA